MDFKIYSDNFSIQSAPPHQVVDWGVDLVKAPKLWSFTKGEGMKIAVLDTGIDFNHPDLADNYKKGINFTSSNSSDVMDRKGHGTHVAGIIAAVDNDKGIVGVAPKAELYICKVLADDGNGSISSIIEGIHWAINQEVDIISMSLGASVDPGKQFYDAIKLARENGIIIVAASGNENSNVVWPAAYEEVLAVGAIDQSLDRASFSNYGKELDVTAPGVDILSTYPGNRYATLSGTSMATPMVAGVVALIQAYCRLNNIKATPEKIIELIQESSRDLGEFGRDDSFGQGLIDLSLLVK